MCSPIELTRKQELQEVSSRATPPKSDQLPAPLIVSMCPQQENKNAVESNLESAVHTCSNRRCRRSVAVKPLPLSDVRSRYYHKLGIHAGVGQHAAPSARPAPAVLREPLKQDDGTVSTRAMTTATLLSSSSTLSCSSSEDLPLSPPRGRSRSVSFEGSVEVRHIPMRKEYSSRIRKQLWPNRTEAQQSAHRNAVEFAAENWDWRQAAEEQDMIMVEGNLVHPIHCMQRCNVQRQFFLVMSAQCAR